MIAASVPESEDVIKVLLRAGADINAKSCVPFPHLSPLHENTHS